MREKLTAHFRKFGPKRFVVATILILTLTDLVNSWYLRLWWVAKDMSGRGVQMSADNAGISIHDLNAESINEIRQLFDNMFFFFLFIIIANNLFFYLFYLRRKLWAQGFVLFYALTAAILSAMFIFDNAGLGMAWNVYNILMIFVYTYLFLGVKYLKADTVDLPK